MPTLAEIIAGAPLADPLGADVRAVPLRVAVRLAATMDDDVYALRLGRSGDAYECTITVQRVRPQYVILSAFGLRYWVDTREDVPMPQIDRLCLITGCQDEAMSYRSRLTLVCPIDHLDAPLHLHGLRDTEHAIRRSERLDAWDEISAEEQKRLTRTLNVIENLRDEEN